jgi:hypothetical protein
LNRAGLGGPGADASAFVDSAAGGGGRDAGSGTGGAGGIAGSGGAGGASGSGGAGGTIGSGGTAGMDAGLDVPGGQDAGQTCGAGTHPCGTSCVADDSTSGCGSSCSPCTAPPNATATCDGTSCGFQCDDTFHPCGEACASNGSTDSCGATSCSPCPVPANGSSTCDGTACGFTCDTSFVPDGSLCVPGCDSQCDAASVPVINGGGRITGTTSGASTSAGSCGGGLAPEAVFKLTLTATSDVFVTTHGTQFDTVVYMRRGGCCGTEIACNDNADFRATSVLSQKALAPGTYYIFVDGADANAAGAYTVDIYYTATSANAADACGNPARISTAAVSGNTCGYRDDYDPVSSCTNGQATSSDAVYYFVLDAPATVTFDTCTGTCLDTLLYVRDICNEQLSQEVCDDDSCTASAACAARGVQSRATTALAAGVHYLVLDTFANNFPTCGGYTITPAGVPP